jgi:hypothetical protein
MLLSVAATTAFVSCTGPPACPDRSVAHPPAGSCIIPDLLEVYGDRDAVETAVFQFGGEIAASPVADIHYVRFDVATVVDLDAIKHELNADGVDARYARVDSP